MITGAGEAQSCNHSVQASLFAQSLTVFQIFSFYIIQFWRGRTVEASFYEDSWLKDETT